jgi:hypothetical protein
MSKERFIALVKNPALLKADDAPFLEELLKEFPYFQTAHLLAARCYKVSDSIHLQKQIKTAATHITDRKVLYNLIENFQTIESTKEIEKNDLVKTDKISSNSIQEIEVNEINAATDSAQNAYITNDSSEIIEEVKLIQDLPIIESVKLVEIPEVEDLEKQLNHDDSIAENQQNNEAQQENVEQNVESQEEKIEITIIEAEIPLENEIKLAIAETRYLQEFEQKLVENVKIAPETEVISQISEEVSSQEKEIIIHVEEKEPENLAQTTDFVGWLKNLEKNKNDNAKSSKQKPINEGEKLIDAFIEKPIQRAKPIKQEFFSPVNMAKQSVSDNDFFVTETLAKIYIKQGNLTKAIKVYQNLSLKSPEKNNIFAAQIKILKEQLHNKTGK